MALTMPDKATALPEGILGPAEPEEILYEAEEPVVFTLVTALGQRVMAYLADATPDTRWLLLAPCGDRLLDDLKQGRVPVRDALQASWVWLAKLGNDDQWQGAWAVEVADLPDLHLPQPGVMLLPEHEPVLSTRAVGAGIGRSSTPASVVAYLADATRKAVKGILEFVLERDRQGRPPDDLRMSYDLPVQRFAYASFEIAFSAPASLFQDPALDRSIELLRKGLRWAASGDEKPLSAASDDERDAVLRAIKQLTPPSTGAIERIDVSGRWMEHGVAELRRSARRRVQAELRRTRTERILSKEGRLREFDKDNCTFILRDTPDGVDVRGSFDEAMYDEFLDYFTNDDRVVVVGVERAGKLYAAAVSGVLPME